MCNDAYYPLKKCRMNMKNKLITSSVYGAIFTLLFTATPIQAKSYYTWVDANGKVHYSDTPPPNTNQPVVAQPLPSYPAPTPQPQPQYQPQPAPQPTPQPTPVAQKVTYASKVSISSPQNKATIRDNSGNITINASTNHPLQSDQSLRLVINGRTVATQRSTRFQLNNVDRGEQQIRVELLTQNKVVDSSSVVVYLHRATVNQNN